jgi:YggT family protein
MDFVRSIVDIIIVLLFLRILIRPSESYYNPIYHLIYRITDFFLVPVRLFIRNNTLSTFSIILGFIIIRGLIYILILPMPVIAGIALSCLHLFQFLFQAYFIIWLISLSNQFRFGMPLFNVMERALNPLRWFLTRLGVSRRRFHFFAFFLIWIVYALFAVLFKSQIFLSTVWSYYTVLSGLVEGLMLIIALFTFPGFFSLIIIIGALLSFVSPDRSNPIVQAIYGISAPLLRPFQRLIPPLGGLDFSPLVALLFFQFAGMGAQALLQRGLFLLFKAYPAISLPWLS